MSRLALLLGSAGTPEHLSLSVAFAAVCPVEACTCVLRRVYVSLAASLGNANITLAYDVYRSLFPGPRCADESMI